MRTPIRRAFTLVEIMIASVLLLGVLFIVSLVLQQNTDQTRFDLAANEANQSSRMILQRVSKELVDAGGDEFNGDYLTSHPFAGPAASSSTVTFKRRVDTDPVADQATSEANNWGPQIEYRLVAYGDEDPTNGTDDDGDGLIDEQMLVRESLGQTTTIAHDVLEFTISRDPTNNPDQVRIKVEVARVFDRNPDAARRFVSSVAESTVVIRNRPHTE